jgi:hypothetical protein
MRLRLASIQGTLQRTLWERIHSRDVGTVDTAPRLNDFSRMNSLPQ